MADNGVSPGRNKVWVPIVLCLITVIGSIIVAVITHPPSPPSPPPTPTPPIPRLHTAYNGNMLKLGATTSFILSLSMINENPSGHFTGNAVIGSCTSATVEGDVDNKGEINFIVTEMIKGSTCAGSMGTFSGFIGSDNNLSGKWTSNTGPSGTWSLN